MVSGAYRASLRGPVALQPMALEVRVEQARCIATKACMNAAPRTFALDSNEVAVVVDPGAHDEADVVRAAESCPTAAITVFKDGEQLF